MLSLEIIALLLLSLFLKWMWSRKALYLLSWKMSGPVSFPFVGSLFEILSKPDSNLSWNQSLNSKYGHTYRVWIGPLLFVCISKVEHIQSILSSLDCVNRADLPKKLIVEAVGDESIFTLEDERWKKSRRVIGPSFNYSVVITYLPIFNKQSMYCVDELRKYVGSGSFDIRPVIEEATIFSFINSTLGGDISRHLMKEYAETVSKRQKLIQRRINQPCYQFDFIWNLSKPGREANKLDKEAKRIKDDIFRPCYESSPNATLQQRLLQIDNKNDQLTYGEVLSEVTAVMLSGTESTAGPISITLLLLAMHQDIQDKVIEELRQVLPDQKSTVTREDLKKMKFLDMCVREELRLFPSVPVTIRKNNKVLQLDDVTLPIGTSIVISFHQLQRNPLYWPNANNFDPYRFLPENAWKIVPFSFLPFGTGTRECIGNTYAMIVVKTFLATILRNYKVTTDLKFEDLTVDSAITIIVNDSRHMVQLEARDY